MLHWYHYHNLTTTPNACPTHTTHNSHKMLSEHTSITDTPKDHHRLFIKETLHVCMYIHAQIQTAHRRTNKHQHVHGTRGTQHLVMFVAGVKCFFYSYALCSHRNQTRECLETCMHCQLAFIRQMSLIRQPAANTLNLPYHCLRNNMIKEYCAGHNQLLHLPRPRAGIRKGRLGYGTHIYYYSPQQASGTFLRVHLRKRQVSIVHIHTEPQ